MSQSGVGGKLLRPISIPCSPEGENEFASLGSSLGLASLTVVPAGVTKSNSLPPVGHFGSGREQSAQGLSSPCREIKYGFGKSRFAIDTLRINTKPGFAPGHQEGFDTQSIVRVRFVGSTKGYGIATDPATVVTVEHLILDKTATVGDKNILLWSFTPKYVHAVVGLLLSGLTDNPSRVYVPAQFRPCVLGEKVRLVALVIGSDDACFSEPGEVQHVGENGEIVVAGIPSYDGLSGAPYVAMSDGKVVGVHVEVISGTVARGSALQVQSEVPVDVCVQEEVDAELLAQQDQALAVWQAELVQVEEAQGRVEQVAGVADVPGSTSPSYASTQEEVESHGMGGLWRRVGLAPAIYVLDIGWPPGDDALRVSVRVCASGVANVAASPMFGANADGSFRAAPHVFTVVYPRPSVDVVKGGYVPGWARSEIVAHIQDPTRSVWRMLKSVRLSEEASFHGWLLSGGRVFLASSAAPEIMWSALSMYFRGTGSGGSRVAWVRSMQEQHLANALVMDG